MVSKYEAKQYHSRHRDQGFQCCRVKRGLQQIKRRPRKSQFRHGTYVFYSTSVENFPILYEGKTTGKKEYIHGYAFFLKTAQSCSKNSSSRQLNRDTVLKDKYLQFRNGQKVLFNFKFILYIFKPRKKATNALVVTKAFL